MLVENFGHISNQCRTMPYQMNFRPMENNVVCRACNKTNHIAKYCRSKNSAPVDKNKSNAKGKAKVDEIRDQHKKMWIKKDESKADGGSVLEFDVDASSDNSGFWP